MRHYIILLLEKEYMTNFVEEFIDKMGLVPNNVNRLLRLIRKLDRKVEELQTTLST